MTRTELLDLIDVARGMVKNTLGPAPNSWLDYLDRELVGLASMIRDHWPLTEQEKSTIGIGVFAVRNLDELYPGLSSILKTIDGYISRDGEDPDS